jgi:hypothetical protein
MVLTVVTTVGVLIMMYVQRREAARVTDVKQLSDNGSTEDSSAEAGTKEETR